MTALHCEIPLRNPEKCVSASTWCIDTPILAPNKPGNEVNNRTLSSFVEDENENEIMTWHALGHWDENIVFGAKIES